MLELAVITHEETFSRMKDPLEDRGIISRNIQAYSRQFPISQTIPEDLQNIDVGFVYPARIMEGGVIDSLLNVPWVNGLEEVLTSRNKGKVLSILSRGGFDTPSTIMISNPIGEDELVEAYCKFDSPVVIKPNSATRGIGIALVNDIDSFIGIVDYIKLIQSGEAIGDRTFLIQEYIPDAIDCRVMIIDGEYAGAVERKFIGDNADVGKWKKNVHKNAIAVKKDMPDSIQKMAEEVAQMLKIQYLGIDLLISEDRVVINETNARATIDDEKKYIPEFYDKLADLIKSVAI